MQTVDVDKDAQFQCIVSGHPVHDVNWLHDGKPILRDTRIEVTLICCQMSILILGCLIENNMYKTLPFSPCHRRGCQHGQILTDPARLFIKKVQKEDQGMYQCFVSNEWEQIQSTSELQLGGNYNWIGYISSDYGNG